MAVSILDDYPPGTRRGNTCSCCGAGRRMLRDPDGRPYDERVVDLNEQIDWEGHLMVCESCVVEAARLLGMIHPVEKDAAVAAMHELQAAADELLAERDEARQLVDLMRGYDEHRGGGLPDVGELIDCDHMEPLPKPARKPRAKATA